MVQLPIIPSQLIRLAIKDLEKAEQNSDYEINMNTWHLPSSTIDRKCTICLAGAVMAYSLGVNINNRVLPCDFRSDIKKQLKALNCFRSGDIHYGLSYLDLHVLHLDKNLLMFRNIPQYELNPIEFKKAMLLLANDLESINL